MANASETIADVADSVEAAGAQANADHRPIAWTTGQAGTRHQPSPADSMRAAVVLFDLTMSALERHVLHDHDLLPCFTTAVLALNESIGRRVRAETIAYVGYLFNRMQQAHIEEQHRIARDLHDRIGGELTVGLRQLDLHEISDPGDPLNRTAIARQALVETMRELRLVTSGLRQEPVTCLEKALIRYLDSAAGETEVQLRVSGDERWAPPAVIDEVFLIIREAARNALSHAAPQQVLVEVDIAPYELRALVGDDGRGFVPGRAAGSAFSGTGLASMRERAEVIEGLLTVSSVPGHGTRVELLVPLPGHSHEQSG
jgi:signal transduction histidine kinase